MGQYYIAIILADKGTNAKKEYIRLYIKPHYYNVGAKLMEHSYLGTGFMKIIEGLIGPQGIFYKSRLVWAGDYAKEDLDSESDEDCGNLYHLTESVDNYKKCYTSVVSDVGYYRYIVNHTQKMYVDKEKCILEEAYNIHPLPLLTSEGNGRGGGDYRGSNEHLCGTWARDTVSMENTIPDDYNELVCEFSEY
jgi:hypothetical protein